MCGALGFKQRGLGPAGDPNRRASSHEIALDSEYAGHDDWRVPNIKELLSLVAFNRWRPAMNLDAFPDPGANYNYMSSTRVTVSVSNNNPDSLVTRAFFLSPFYGQVRYKAIDEPVFQMAVLLVRTRGARD
ncbi:MAG: DUF1566 domain-containing protein [Myxococcota bacterium]